MREHAQQLLWVATLLAVACASDNGAPPLASDGGTGRDSDDLLTTAGPSSSGSSTAGTATGEDTGASAATDEGATTTSPATTQTGDQTGSSSSGSNTSGSDAECEQMFVDTFDDANIDRSWLVIGEAEAQAGQLLFTIDASAESYSLLYAQGRTGLDLTRGWMAIEIDRGPQAVGAQGTLTLRVGDLSYFWLFENGGVRVVANGGSPAEGGLDETWSDDFRWVRIRGEGSRLVYEYSSDGQRWTYAASEPDVASVDEIELAVSAGSYRQLGRDHEFAIETIEYCYDQ